MHVTHTVEKALAAWLRSALVLPEDTVHAGIGVEDIPVDRTVIICSCDDAENVVGPIWRAKPKITVTTSSITGEPAVEAHTAMAAAVSALIAAPVGLADAFAAIPGIAYNGMATDAANEIQGEGRWYTITSLVLGVTTA